MYQTLVKKIVMRQDLEEEEMTRLMDRLMAGELSEAQIGALMGALATKGETFTELAGAARSMRRKAVRIHAASTTVVDTCGTGGDGAQTFNISTTAAFVVAGCGAVVAKHGNRAVSSGCGSADVLEALGVKIDAAPEIVEECLQQIGIGFLFAPRLHGAMKHAIGPRREIGIRTIFNMLGPLTNPAGATAQLIGVYDPRLTEMFAGVLKNLGTKRAFVVHGADGLDEATVTGETRVSELKEGLVTTYNIDPMELLGESFAAAELRGGDAETNARTTIEILSGETGARRGIVVLNAALAIVAGGKAAGIREGIAVAEACIDSGGARKKLQALIEHSHS